MEFLKVEEHKSTTTSAKVEGRYLKVGDYRFALSKESGDDQRVIRISMEEIEKLNDKYEVSTSILDFVLQSKHDEFLQKGVKVLPTRVLRDIMGSDQNQGQILQDAVRAPLFDFKAVVLPYVTEGRWDLFVLFSPRIMFNQQFQKLCPSIQDLMQAVSHASAKKQKKKKKKLRARITHISSSEDQSQEQVNSIYKTLNAYFAVAYPGENIETYLSTGADINQDNCNLQWLKIKHMEDSGGVSGGYLIYSFLSQVFLKDKQLTADVKNIEYANWFSNIDGELDEIKHQLKEIPGTKLVEQDGDLKVRKRDSFFLNTPERSSSTDLVNPLKLENVKPFLEQEANKVDDVIAEDGPEDSERDTSQIEISKEQLANVIDVEITDQLKKQEEEKKEPKVVEFEDPFAYDDELPKTKTPPPVEESPQMVENGEELLKSETCPPGIDQDFGVSLSQEINAQVEVPTHTVPEKEILEIGGAAADEVALKTQTPPPQELDLMETGAELLKSETGPSGLDVNVESGVGVNIEPGIQLADQIPTKTQTPPPQEEVGNAMLEQGEELMKSETCPAGMEEKKQEELESALPKQEMIEIEDAFAYEAPVKPKTPKVEEDLIKSETCPPEGIEAVFENKHQLSNEELLKSVSLQGQGAEKFAEIEGDKGGIAAAEVSEKLKEEIKANAEVKRVEPFTYEGEVPETPHPSEDLGLQVQDGLQSAGLQVQGRLEAAIPPPAKPDIIEEAEMAADTDNQNLLESSAPGTGEVEFDSGLGVVLDKGDGALEYEVDGMQAAENQLKLETEEAQHKLKDSMEADSREYDEFVKKEDVEIQITGEEEIRAPIKESSNDLMSDHALISEQLSKEVNLPQDQDFSIPVSAEVENASAVELTQERVVYGEAREEQKEEEDRNSTPSPRKSINEVTSQIQMRLRKKGIYIQPDYQPAKLLEVNDAPQLHRTPSEEKLSRLEKVTPGNQTIKTDSSYLSPPPKKKLDMEKRKQRGEISYDDHYQRKAGCCSGCSIF